MADEPPKPGTVPPGVPRERRPALWPWLVMPLVVLLMFYVLHTVHQHARLAGTTRAASSGSATDNR